MIVCVRTTRRDNEKEGRTEERKERKELKDYINSLDLLQEDENIVVDESLAS